MLANNRVFQGSANAPIGLLEPTLADVHTAIEQDTSLPKPRRDSLCCSIRRVAKFLERDLAHLPARLGALRYGIARLHHAQLGVSRKTLRNHLANLKAAVRRFAGLERLSGRGIPFTPPWMALYDRIPVPRLRLGLSGFLRYCSACGIDPSSVSDATVAAFIGYASEVQFTVKPNNIHKQVARCWNLAKERVPGWPQTILTVPDFRPKAQTLPWGAFLPSFVKDVECYLARLRGENLLDEDAPDRACKPSTIENSKDLPEARRLSRREPGCPTGHAAVAGGSRLPLGRAADSRSLSRQE